MNTTMDHLDRNTHIKIVIIALVAATLVFAVSINAKLGGSQIRQVPDLVPTRSMGVQPQQYEFIKEVLPGRVKLV